LNDFLDTKQQEIASRLRELQPAIEEYRRLEAAQAALASIPALAATATTLRAPRGRKAAKPQRTASKPAAKGARRPGRRKGSGARAGQALAVIQGQPGITTGELAKAMGIKPNYLYRILPSLQKERKIAKKGRGWEAKT
jgi:hypothetical protein